MKIKSFIFFITIFCCISNYLNGQIAMGSWQTHISYLNVEQITQSREKIYGTSTGALFSIHKEDNLIETYSKISGLNDNNIHFIKYSEQNNILFIAYKNSNIDLLSEDENKMYGGYEEIVNAIEKNGGIPIGIFPDMKNLSFCNGLIFQGGDFFTK